MVNLCTNPYHLWTLTALYTAIYLLYAYLIVQGSQVGKNKHAYTEYCTYQYDTRLVPYIRIPYTYVPTVWDSQPPNHCTVTQAT